MKLNISLLLISLFLNNCATNKKVNIIEQQSTKNISIEAQINSLDAQLIHIDAMINASKARKNVFQADPMNINNSMIENEIMGYELQKANIISQKNALQLQLNH